MKDAAAEKRSRRRTERSDEETDTLLKENEKVSRSKSVNINSLICREEREEEKKESARMTICERRGRKSQGESERRVKRTGVNDREFLSSC